jgi:hypothetical protein
MTSIAEPILQEKLAELQNGGSDASLLFFSMRYRAELAELAIGSKLG